MSPQALNEMPLFAGCSRKELERVRSLSTFLDVAPGKTLTLQGETGYECLLVCQGAIDIVRDGRPIAQAGPGDLVGEIALLDKRPGLRTATARTVTQAQVLVFNSREFATLLHEMPAVASRVQQTTVHRLIEHLGAGGS